MKELFFRHKSFPGVRFECCGLIWELLLSRKWLERYCFKPVCPRCEGSSHETKKKGEKIHTLRELPEENRKFLLCNSCLQDRDIIDTQQKKIIKLQKKATLFEEFFFF